MNMPNLPFSSGSTAMLAAMLLGSCVLPASAAQCRPDRILIQPRAGATPDAISALHRAQEGKVLRSFPAMGHLQVISVPQGRVEASILAYKRSGLVVFAEPDYARQLALTPNDPQFTNGTLWGLNNIGQNGGTPDADIDAPEAWDVLNSASNIIVAVLDTGIRSTHEDLAANVWTNAVLGGYGWNALDSTTTPADDEGHGSLVSGILGAVGNNGKGVTGVAWRVQVMACKCFNANQLGFDSDIIECIDFARTNGARVVNASLGSYDYSAALSNAIHSLGQQGIIFVAACGNDARNIDATPYYPASIPLDNIVSVAFTTRNDLFDTRSNFGATNVDLAAPGTAIYSTFFSSDSMYLGGSFLYGSSLAAPYVTGSFALLLAKYPGESHQQIIHRLLSGVDPLPSLAGKCGTGGRLNLRNALSPPLLLSFLSPGLPITLRLSAGPNRQCVIETSPDLNSWSAVLTNTTSSNGTFDFIDTQSSTASQTFYRASSAP